MRRFLALLLVLPSLARAEERLDVLTFTAPAGWEREAKPTGVDFSHVDRATRSWCQLSVHRPVPTRGSLVRDFEADWKAFVASSVSTGPKVTEGPDVGGWKGRSGLAWGRFNAERMLGRLVTLNGNGQAVSVVLKGNTEHCVESAEALVASMHFAAP